MKTGSPRAAPKTSPVARELGLEVIAALAIGERMQVASHCSLHQRSSRGGSRVQHGRRSRAWRPRSRRRRAMQRSKKKRPSRPRATVLLAYVSALRAAWQCGRSNVRSFHRPHKGLHSVVVVVVQACGLGHVLQRRLTVLCVDQAQRQSTGIAQGVYASKSGRAIARVIALFGAEIIDVGAPLTIGVVSRHAR